MNALPIDAVLAELIAAVAHDGTSGQRSVVLQAPTGAGKTTRVPGALLEAYGGRVLMSEPRRVAARAAARRIASERGARVGDEVGYQVRFDSRVSAASSIVVATEGVILRQLQDDPFLDGISALVFDEFHERSLDSDVTLALARQIQREVRPDLIIVVMSATLVPAPLAEWLGGVPIVRSEGRAYPVATEHLPKADDRRIEAQAAAAVRRLAAETEGHILVFLPGVGEIRRTEEFLQSDRTHGLRVLTLHGRLESEEQDAVIRPSEGRKVILSTNVAESSLTIPGVTTVIDSGLARVMRYDPSVGFDRLVLERISLASAEQRAGRAGREGPGRCLRLWPSAVEYRMSEMLEAEMQRVDLAGVMLQMLAFGEPDPATFDWYEAPDQARWEDAATLLDRLGCTHDAALTDRGRDAAALPLHPRLACVLLAGAALGVAADAANVCALISGPDVVKRPHPREFVVRDSDSDLADRAALVASDGRNPTSLANRLQRGALFEAKRVARQLSRVTERKTGRGKRAQTPVAGSPREALRRALLAGFPDRVCRRRDGDLQRAAMVGARGVQMGPHTALRDDEPLFVAIDVTPARRGSTGDGVVVLASAISEDWLPADAVIDEIQVQFDPAIDKVRALRVKRFLDLELRNKSAPTPSGEAVSAALAAAAASRLTNALPLDQDEFARARDRFAWLADARPELGLPDLSDDALLEYLPELCLGKRSFAELRSTDLLAYFRARLPWAAWQQLDEFAPASVAVPSGRAASLRYEAGSRPVLAVRIQELFGMVDTPRVNGGKSPVLVHLLAPNMRPQQITADLRSFWETGYPEVRKELRARYPKHSWPDDPLTAKAERRPRRKR